ncbi:ABC transporter ATP-binding protein [Candidatus Jorgensenbacteria bacterium]|nr:ABC transporter ATP-binding protein [Candidatus Jorgensenbacteria bacterium]
MISVNNLIKDYIDDGSTTRALTGVSFEIEHGEFVAIMGPSGSGKSTLLHILSFLDRPTDGTYTIFGKSINDLSDNELARVRNKQMGFVFQAFNLLGRSSVYENVELPLLYSTVPASKRKHLIEGAINAVDLNEKIKIEAGKLSGGQKQRVAIARALVNEPDLLFADEPTGNLDSKSGAQVMEILKKLNDSGKTIILVTHETYTASYAGRILHMQDGSIDRDEFVPLERRTKRDLFK